MQNLHNGINAAERDVGALSNTLVVSYIRQSKKANFDVVNVNVSAALTIKGAPLSYNYLKDLPVIALPGYLPPISLTTNTQEVSGVYLYESSITPDNELLHLTSFEDVIRYENLTQWLTLVVISLSLPVPTLVTKYALRRGILNLSVGLDDPLPRRQWY